MLVVKNGKLVALDENDQKVMLKLYEAGGRRIFFDCTNEYASLVIRNLKGKEVGSLVGEDAYYVNILTNNILLKKEGMQLSDFIEKFCPLFSSDNHVS